MKQAIHRFVLIFTVVFLVTVGYGQTMPKLVSQVTFDLGLDDVQSSAKGNWFLVISGNNYTLIDQTSKIQVGTLVFDASGWGAQGVGKTALMADGSVLISTGFVLVKADLITGKVDTFFNQIKFPEIIENFTLWPDDETKVLINTKTYPMKKDSTISYLSDNKEKNEYLGPVNCKLYLVDAKTKTVTQTAPTAHLITTFAAQAQNGGILAGTLSGDVVGINESLQQNTLFRAFDTAIHQLLVANGSIIVVPSREAKYVGGDYGDGRICIYKNGKREHELLLDEQEPADKYSMVAPSPSVFRVFKYPNENSVVVNYGFSRLLKVNLASADTSHYPVSLNMAKFYCWSSDSTQLLSATDDIQDLFASSRNQDLYDINRKKFQPAFRKIQLQDKYSQFFKVFDEQGNYHIIAYKADYSSDTLVVFSSNKTQPTTIACKWCKIVLDGKDNSLAIIKYNQTKWCKLLFNKMQRSSYTIDFNAELNILEPIFSTENISEEKLPKSIINVNKLTEGNYALASDNAVMVVNNNGVVLEINKLKRLFSGELFAISPSKKYLAIINAGEKRHSIEIWDWVNAKKVFTIELKKDVEIRHFTFDKTLDVLWYSANYWTTKNGRELINEVYSIDLSVATPKEKYEFTDSRFFSFEVDMRADRVAFEAYSELYVAKLSNRELLWQQTPRESFFKVNHLSNGFTFSTEEEMYTVLNDNTQLYFTSYAGRKFIEVADNYLYRGDKSAVNNLAFAYKGKGYLPVEYDIYFNRPDTVVLLSGSSNQAFNELLKGAVDKRLRRIKAKTIENIIGKEPEVKIVNKSQLPLVLTSDEVVLEIALSSLYADVYKLQVMANGVPVFGKEGMPVSGGREAKVNCKVKLQKGNNVVQVYVTDVNGVKSATETITIVAEYEANPSKIYFIGIGIDEFKEPGHNLKYSVKDIVNLAEGLKAKLGDQLVIDTLFNSNVSLEKVMALRNRLLQANVNDRLIVSYSGHGLLDKQLEYYLSTYMVNFRNPNEGGLPYTMMEQLLDSLPMRRKLLLIDACHSGEVDKDEMENMRVVFSDTTKHINNGGKNGIELLVDDEQVVGLKNSFELMQEMFADVGRGTGTTIISAAAGTQVAYEKGELQNGVFTYCVLQLLSEKQACTVQELKAFVGIEVERLTDGLQRPTSRTETAGFDWQVW